MTATVDRVGVSVREAWFGMSERRRIVIIGLFAAAMGFVGFQGETIGRLLIGLFGALAFTLIAITSRDLALTMIIVWLALLGFVRRLLIPFAGWSEADPLLLVSPVIAFVLWIHYRDERPPPRTMLSSMVAFFMLWTAAQIFNPNEPSLITAAKAAMFYVVPLMWFFVGRGLPRDLHQRVLDTTFWMMFVVVGHGLYQTYFQLLPFEYTWVGVSGFGESLFLPGFKIRPFSTLVSPQEYGIFLGIGIVITYARVLYRRGPRGPQVLFLLVSAWALFLQGSRSIFLFALLAFFVMTFVHLRSLPATLGIIAVLGLIIYGSTTASPPQSLSEDEQLQNNKSTSQLLVQRQLQGLLNPTGEESTATLHVDLIVEGFVDGVTNPLGRGVSAASIVAHKEGAAETSAESDIANITAVFGIAAGLAYLAFVLLGFAAAFRLQRREPSFIHLVWCGVLVACLNQWWSGSLYSTSTLVFLALGGIATETARSIRDARRPSPEMARA